MRKQEIRTTTQINGESSRHFRPLNQNMCDMSSSKTAIRTNTGGMTMKDWKSDFYVTVTQDQHGLAWKIFHDLFCAGSMLRCMSEPTGMEKTRLTTNIFSCASVCLESIPKGSKIRWEEHTDEQNSPFVCHKSVSVYESAKISKVIFNIIDVLGRPARIGLWSDASVLGRVRFWNGVSVDHRMFLGISRPNRCGSTLGVFRQIKLYAESRR